MRKNIFILTFIFMLLTSCVHAQTSIKVVSMDDFSTAAPSQEYRVRLIDPVILANGKVLPAGTIVSGPVSNVQNAKRLKRDGYFEFMPNSISINGKTKTIKNPRVTVKVVGYEPLDSKQLVESVAKTAAGYAIKGATQGISFVQGLVQDDDGNRLVSGVTKVYKDSPLSYIDEGSELNLKVGDTVILIIKDPQN